VPTSQSKGRVWLEGFSDCHKSVARKWLVKADWEHLSWSDL
jgi:hypothetical protein